MGGLVLIICAILFGAVAWRHQARAVAFTVFALPLYVVRFSVGPFPTTLLETLILSLVCVWAVRDGRNAVRELINAVRMRARDRRTLLVAVSIVAFLVAATISIAVSPHLISALGVWRAYFIEPALFFIVFIRTIRTKQQMNEVLSAIFLSGFLVAAWALVQRVTGWGLSGELLVERRVTSVFPYPNAVGLYLAGIILIIAPVVISRAREMGAGLRKAVYLSLHSIAIGSMIAAIFFAKTEAALAALALVGVVAAVLWSETARIRALTLVVLAALAVTASGPLLATISRKAQLKDWSGKVRRTVWSESRAMLSDRWLFGAGLAGYQTTMEPYHKAKHLEIFLYPHSLFLNFWSETGLVGAAALLFLVASFFIFIGTSAARLKKIRDPGAHSFARALTFGLTSSMSVILLHGLVDVPYFKNDLSVFFWTLLGLAIVLDRWTKGVVAGQQAIRQPGEIAAEQPVAPIQKKPSRKKRANLKTSIVFACAWIGLIAWEQTGAVNQLVAPTQWRAEVVRTVHDTDFACADSTCLTESISLSGAFQTLVIEWPKVGDVQARVFDSGRWSEWMTLEGEADVRDGENADKNAHFFSAYQGTNVQFRRSVQSIGEIRVTAFTVPTLASEPRYADFRLASMEDPSSATVLPRSQWLDSGIELSNERRTSLWPEEYGEVKKIILHHTASTVRDINNDGMIDSLDYRELVRAIYRYHASSKKWGDIGYQFIIDPSGAIYEGRAGGDGVVGGHAYRDRGCTKFGTSNMPFNKGTIGIAMLGTYGSEQITPAAQEALTTLIAGKAWEFEFEPIGTQFFQDRIYPNVIAHRDVDCTSCPGDQLYSSLSEITNISQQKFDFLSQSHTKQYRAELISGTVPERVYLAPGQSQEIRVQFRNTGTATWRGYGSSKIALQSSAIKERLASLESVRLAAVSENKEEADGRDLASSSSTPPTTGIKLLEPNVRPGEIGTFRLAVSDPPSELESERSYVMTLGERGWFGSSEISFEIENTGLPYAATEVLEEGDDGSLALARSEKNQITRRFVNRGTSEWKRGDVVLRIGGQEGDTTLLKDRTWKKSDGQFNFKEKSVKPGEMATFQFQATPAALGPFNFLVRLTHKDDTLSGSDYLPLEGTVLYARAAELKFASFPKKALKGETIPASVTFENIGLEPWKQPTFLGLATKGKSPSAFAQGSWKKTGVIGADELTENGEFANVVFDLAAPTKPGTYDLRIVLKDGKTTIPVVGAKGLQDDLITRITVFEEKKPVKKTVTKKMTAKK